MAFSRLPRFKRSSNIDSLRLTERDRSILHHVHRHRFLRSSHLSKLIPGSHQQILRRLKLLYHHSYLERPRAQIDYYHRGGSRVIAYGLGNKGAKLLEHEFGLKFHRVDWDTRNRRASRLFLEHALMISDVMVAIEIACRKNARVRFLGQEDLPLPKSTRQLSDPFRWTVGIGSGNKIGVIPDRVFGLEIMIPKSNPTRVLFFLEADRGTMPVVRQTLSKSSILKKLLAYEATWKQNLHRSRFKFLRFRVLTVTTSMARVSTLASACRKLSRGHGLFLFNDIATVTEQSDLLSLPFQSGHAGNVVTLLE